MSTKLCWHAFFSKTLLNQWKIIRQIVDWFVERKLLIESAQTTAEEKALSGIISQF